MVLKDEFFLRLLIWIWSLLATPAYLLSSFFYFYFLYSCFMSMCNPMGYDRSTPCFLYTCLARSPLSHYLFCISSPQSICGLWDSPPESSTSCPFFLIRTDLRPIFLLSGSYMLFLSVLCTIHRSRAPCPLLYVLLCLLKISLRTV